MKKNFYCFIVLFFLISCDFPSIRREESYFVTNLTGKKLIHQIRYDKEVKGLDTLSFFSEGNSDKAEFEWIVISEYNVRNVINAAINTNVYNITDTTSFGWSYLWSEDDIYTRFGEIINKASFKDGENTIEKVDVFLTIDNELLLLMKKDYTMLDKFKEYYQK